MKKNPHSTHKDNFLERVKVTKYEPFKIVTEIQNSILFAREDIKKSEIARRLNRPKNTIN